MWGETPPARLRSPGQLARHEGRLSREVLMHMDLHLELGSLQSLLVPCWSRFSHSMPNWVPIGRSVSAYRMRASSGAG